MESVKNSEMYNETKYMVDEIIEHHYKYLCAVDENIRDSSRDELSSKLLNLINYVENSSTGVIQGTQEWLDRKSKSIGGSEISALDGSSGFKSLRDIMLAKTGLSTSFSASIQTRWGNVCEEFAQLLVESAMQTKIMGTEIQIAGRIKYHTYSPDGIGVVHKNDVIKAIMTQAVPQFADVSDSKIAAISSGVDAMNVNSPPPERILSIMKTPVIDVIRRAQTAYGTNAKSNAINEFVTVLFEFKCPFSRIPSKTSPPKYYTPQVLSGLDNIRIADVGMLIELVIRYCELGDAGYNNKFNRTLESAFRTTNNNIPEHAMPLYIGVMGFTLIDSDENRDKYVFMLNEFEIFGNAKTYFDMGKFDSTYLDQFFRLVMEGVLKVTYFIPTKIDSQCGDKVRDDIVRTTETFSKTPGAVGFLTLKVFDVAYHAIERIDGYLDQFEKKIKDVVELINECNAISDRRERYTKLLTYFDTDDIFE